MRRRRRRSSWRQKPHRQRTPAPPKGKKKKKALRRIADGSVRWRGYPHRFFKEGRRICGRLGDAFVLGRELARRSLRLSVVCVCVCVCVGWRSFHQKKSQREAAPMAFWRRGGVGWWSRSLLLRNCITAFLPLQNPGLKVKNRSGQWEGPGGGGSTGALCTGFTLVLYIKATVLSVCLCGQCLENSSNHGPFPVGLPQM